MIQKVNHNYSTLIPYQNETIKNHQTGNKPGDSFT